MFRRRLSIAAFALLAPGLIFVAAACQGDTLAPAAAQGADASAPDAASATAAAGETPTTDAVGAQMTSGEDQGAGAEVRLSAKTWAEIGSDDPLYDPWARVLEDYVDGEGLVDYEGLTGTGRADLRAFIEAIGNVDPDRLASDNEKMVFWMNAYNAVVVWQVVERYPIDSVRDLDRLFGLVADFFRNDYRVAGENRTLDNIEYDILRAEYPDARIHWTLVCGAFGCPRLLRRPYVAEDLDPLMTEVSFEFLSNPRALQIDREDNTLYLSSYFNWYGGDFEAEKSDVVDWVLQYAPADKAVWIRENRDSLRVRFMDYDWTLNDQSQGPRSAQPIER